jgi:pyruvate dehydrogenase E2 component (dihydrolipoamide acetyltransferase)
MPTKVIMPQMGESVFEGTITKWLKKAGETVKRDEPLFEISTDKVDSEIPAPTGGILSEILVPEGKTVQINTVVAVIVGEDEGATEKAEESHLPNQAKPAKVPVAGQSRLEVVTPVSTAEREISEAGSEAESAVASRDTFLSPAPPVRAAAPASVQPGDIRTSPLVRRLAREHNVDLALVKGTGLDARITKQDILAYIEQKASELAEAQRGGVPGSEALATEEAMLEAVSQETVTSATPTIEAAAGRPTVLEPAEMPQFAGEMDTVPMTPMRKAIADHMVLSKHTSPHVHTVFEIDLTSIVQLRDKHKAEFERREGIKLTVTPFFAKALVETVRDFPAINCSVYGGNILYKRPVNLGIAVALDNGLIVPVIKNAQLKSFTGLALAIQDLASRARTKRLKPDEVQNGTISMTNPGLYGALFSTPIINQPQVAILGIGGIEKRPVVVNDMIAIRSMVCLSLSFDHRVIDGAVADQFMARLKERLQSWSQWVE